MKVFVLHTGDYEQRMIHSVHSTLEAAQAVDARVRRDWKDAATAPDIEEHELDPALCLTCGYDEALHVKSPDTFTHPFLTEPRS